MGSSVSRAAAAAHTRPPCAHFLPALPCLVSQPIRCDPFMRTLYMRHSSPHHLVRWIRGSNNLPHCDNVLMRNTWQRHMATVDYCSRINGSPPFIAHRLHETVSVVKASESHRVGSWTRSISKMLCRATSWMQEPARRLQSSSVPVRLLRHHRERPHKYHRQYQKRMYSNFLRLSSTDCISI